MLIKVSYYRLKIFVLLIVSFYFIIFTSSVSQAVQNTNREVFSSNRYKFPGVYPTGSAFDGKYFWGADLMDKKIYQISSVDGTVVKSFPSPGDCSPISSISASTMMRTSSVKVTLGSHPRTFFALEASPLRTSTSVGLKYFGSISTNLPGSSPA